MCNSWCKANNLSLNVDKTKEMVVEFRGAQSGHSLPYIDVSSVRIVKSTKFLGVHLAENFTWSLNTSSISEKAQQGLYFLRRLRKVHLPPPILTMFYRGTIKSILSSCITACFRNHIGSQDPAAENQIDGDFCAHPYLSVDYQLPDRQATANEVGEAYIWFPHHQHWCSSGMRVIPTTLLPYTNDCTATDPFVKLLKFADDTTVIGLISDGDESAYKQEVEQLVGCLVPSQQPRAEHTQNSRDDLEKAYDRVPREELWYCMRKSGVAEKYVRVVQDMYERSRTVVRCAVGQTEEFNVEMGLHQGSALSPFLFAIVMDQLSEEVRQESPWTMMFADDIVICSESREQVEVCAGEKRNESQS
ncbi:hypothetical protein QTP86_012519 [Hemibagrus guttatus]|nr:hypothetical protein QTP86_012519 [Hemibagrus guttatus]